MKLDLSKNYLAYIKHFYTKTAEEMCIKINRGDAQFPKEKKIIIRLKKFFHINKMTKNKIKILENCSHIAHTKFIKVKNTKIYSNN